MSDDLLRSSGMNRLTLLFPEELEEEYQKVFFANVIQGVRMAILLGLVMFLGFGLVDVILVPEYFSFSFSLRVGVIGPSFLTFFFYFRPPRNPRHFHLLLTSLGLLGGSVLGVVVATCPPAAFNMHSSGLALVLFYAYSFVRIRFLLCLFIGLYCLCMYSGIVFFVLDLPWDAVLGNLFFLFSANFAGMGTCYFVERQSRRNFLTQKLLQEEKEKRESFNRRLLEEIAARRLNERRLTESEKALRIIFDAADAALFLHDAAGTVVDVNQRGLDLFQTTRSATEGSKLKQFRGKGNPLDQIADIFDRALGGEQVDFEWNAIRSDNAPLELRIHLKGIYLKGEPMVLASVRDIGPQKQAAALREDMDRIIRHDLKSPLNAIVALPSILAEELEDLDDSQRHILRTIENAGYRMLGTINRSIDVISMEHGNYPFRPVQIDILNLARQAAADTERIDAQRGVHIHVLVDGVPVPQTSSITAKGEALLLQAMLKHLLGNAQKRSSADTKILIDIQPQTDQVILEISHAGATAPLQQETYFDRPAEIADVDEERLTRYAARLVVETHEGNISISSTAERSIVQICLPR